MSLGELEALVVSGFVYSKRRPELWKNLLFVLDRLRELNIPCEIWIDGSLLTKKIDPGDVDLLVDIPIEVLDHADTSQSEFIEKLVDKFFKTSGRLESFVMFSAPTGHASHVASEQARRQWAKDWGFAYVSKEPKGIAVIEVTL